METKFETTFSISVKVLGKQMRLQKNLGIVPNLSKKHYKNLFQNWKSKNAKLKILKSLMKMPTN